MKKNGRYFLIYTLILFSVAFILILFSSFTGIRYKDAQYEKSILFQGAQDSVLKLTEVNEELKKENERLTKKVEELSKYKSDNDESIKVLNEQKEIIVKNMDMLAQAQNLYRSKEYDKARDIINQIDETALSDNAKILYDSLKNRL